MKAVGLAVFGEDFEFGFAHSEVPFGLGDGGLFVAVDVFDDVVDGGDAADDEW